MKCSFSAETDARTHFRAAYISFGEGPVASTQELRNSLFVDYDKEYRPIGFELLEPCGEMDLLPLVPVSKRGEFLRFLRRYVPSWLVFPLTANAQIPE